MTPEEQNIYLSERYAEAIRYMDNAKETLKRAEKQDDGYYIDEKYVKTACGTAYSGVLVALDAWLKLKGLPERNKKKRKSIGYYTDSIAKIDKKMGDLLIDAYDILHLYGYYDGVRRVKVIEDGFDLAYRVIDKIKPENPINIPESRGDRTKRVWDKMRISLAVMFRF
jgi:hypothetical protein